jgi:uracil-DNA glycosylase
VRLLNRRQAIDLDELAAEIRESRVASAEATPADGDAPPENRWPES